MIDDRQQHRQVEKADEIRQQREQLAKTRDQMLAEAEAEQRRREQFRQEAVSHWDEARKMKAQKQEGR